MPAFTTSQANRIKYVTANFHQLQGLRLVPLGLWILAGALGQFGWTPWGDFMRGQWSWSGVLITCALIFAYLAIASYYRNHFGVTNRKERSSDDFRRQVAVWIAFFIALGIDAYVRPPINSVAIIFALIVAYVGFTTDRRRAYLVLAIVIAAAGFSPLVTGEAYILSSVVLAAMVAIGVVLVGANDHIILLQALRDVRRGHQSDE